MNTLVAYDGHMLAYGTTEHKSNFELIRLAINRDKLAIDYADLSRLDLEQAKILIDIDPSIVHRLCEPIKSNPDILLLVIRKLEEKVAKLEDKIEAAPGYYSD